MGNKLKNLDNFFYVILYCYLIVFRENSIIGKLFEFFKNLKLGELVKYVKFKLNKFRRKL